MFTSISSNSNEGASSLIIKATDFVLDGNNATFVFSPGFGFLVENSNAVTVKNINIVYDPPSFTQGKVLAINTSEKTVDILLDPGYPTPNQTFFTTVEIKLQFFSPTNRLRVMPESGTIFVKLCLLYTII